MEWVWENGEWGVEISVWYDYPPTVADDDSEFCPIVWISNGPDTWFLTNMFRVWATRDHELDEHNEVLWQAIRPIVLASIKDSHPHLAGSKCEGAWVRIYRNGRMNQEFDVSPATDSTMEWENE